MDTHFDLYIDMPDELWETHKRNRQKRKSVNRGKDYRLNHSDNQKEEYGYEQA